MTKFDIIKIQNQELFSSLIHGTHHALRNPEYGTKNSIGMAYVDITAHSAKSELFATLKKPHCDLILPTSYVDVVSVRGRTIVPNASIFLSPNLGFCEVKQMGQDLLRFLGAFSHGSRPENKITIYHMFESDAIFNSIRDTEYDIYSASSTVILGDSELKSNLTIDNFVSIAIELGYESRVREMPAETFIFGQEMTCMDAKYLANAVSVIGRCNKRVVMHPELHRKYFDAMYASL